MAGQSATAQVVESARAHANGGGVIIAFADSRYVDVLMNWLVGIAAHGIQNYMVIALDSRLHGFLQERRIPTVLSEVSGDLSSLWVRRIEIFSALCAAGVDFVHSDADAVWMRDPRSYLDAPDSDLVISQGTVWPPDVHRQFGFVVCCGLFRLRSTSNTRRLLADLAVHVTDTGDDQVSLNRMLAGQSFNWHFDQEDAYYLEGQGLKFLCSRSAINGVGGAGLRVSVLPHHLFQRVPATLDEAPYVQHLLTPKEPAAKLREFSRCGCLLLRSDWSQIDFDATTLARLRHV
jgi:hypothetical protein